MIRQPPACPHLAAPADHRRGHGDLVAEHQRLARHHRAGRCRAGDQGTGPSPAGPDQVSGPYRDHPGWHTAAVTGGHGASADGQSRVELHARLLTGTGFRHQSSYQEPHRIQPVTARDTPNDFKTRTTLSAAPTDARRNIPGQGEARAPKPLSRWRWPQRRMMRCVSTVRSCRRQLASTSLRTHQLAQFLYRRGRDQLLRRSSARTWRAGPSQLGCRVGLAADMLPVSSLGLPPYRARNGHALTSGSI